MQGYIGGEDDDAAYWRARLAVLRLTSAFPPYMRAEERRRMLDLMEEQFAASGMEVPPWMERLRRELS